ncbi:hypothetical protein GCM10010441_06430 [Kitasatospora paracochleata]|uniref:Acetyl esterase/lipase n=1 Tax=Kitasatospora paracochleata TaxID=58354 RepID=A0ABT1IXG7_9ACTN|nr:alpha/beta hydrolase [Kitasatospora paracochleata]MCP2309571.1 acetyl esterase/lipase [Kitasatospora paracochleata]
MPFGYLVSVLLLALCTLSALVPARRPEPLAQLSFWFAAPVNEVPFAALAWLLLSTLLALTEGDLASPGGGVATGLAALTAGGLALVAARGLRARNALDLALAEALDTHRPAPTTPAPDARPRRPRPWARILAAPFARGRRRAVVRVPNISYGPAGRRNLLDVYHHRTRPTGAPVLIHLHGGGYHHGRKNSQSLPLLYRFASHGWVCVSANYRLRPGVKHPEHLIDLKRVIAWVRAHSGEYGGDPAVLVVSGSSAGGHMAALAALTPGDPAFQPGFENADTSVTAVIALNGYFGNYYGQGAHSSPLAHVSADAPPFFIAHGDNDTMVPIEGARVFADALRRASANPVVYAELHGAQHAFDLHSSPRFEAVVDAAESFTTWVVSHAPHPQTRN